MERWEEDAQEITRLEEKLTEMEAALAIYEEAHRKVRESFKHKTGEKCDCPYCTRNVEALEIHAAEQELKWLEEHTKVLDLQKQVAELELLKEKPKVIGVLKCKWCEEEFTSESLFIEHLQTHLSAQQPTPTPGLGKDFAEYIQRFTELKWRNPDPFKAQPPWEYPREVYEDLRKHYQEQMSTKEKEHLQLRAIQEQIYRAQEEVQKRSREIEYQKLLTQQKETWWKNWGGGGGEGR